MKNELVLNQLGVIELGKEDLTVVDGGSILGMTAGALGALILGALTLEVLMDGSAQCWEDFKDGYNEAREGR